MLPESHHQGRPSAHALKCTTGMVTEASEIAWAEVRQLVMFPVAPYVLHRIEFRRVGRQVLKRDAAAAGGDELPHHPTAMNLRAIPHHQ